MSKSLSELFSFDNSFNGPVKIPNDSHNKQAHSKVVAPIENPDGRRYVSENEYRAHLRSVDNSIKLISDTVARYKMYRDNPMAFLKDLTGTLISVGHDVWHNNYGNYGMNNVLNSSTVLGSTMSGFIPDDYFVPLLPGDREKVRRAIQNISDNRNVSIGGKPTLEELYGEYSNAANEVCRSRIDQDKGLSKDDIESYGEPVRMPDNRLSLTEDHGLYVSDCDTGNQSSYEVLTNNSETSDRAKRDYFTFSDPFTTPSRTIEVSTFSEAQRILDDMGYLTGYHKIVYGFEMGSNHNWFIKIRPYESAAHGQLTCTPPLPAYALPNIWSDPVSRSSNLAWFSYAEHCPVISYDLNFGTFKNGDMKLFNSSMPMFEGMQYNAVMNLSILDDIYGSMTKYMATYINSIYDPVTNSCAPYYNMAFEVELTILRSGSVPNYKFKFICTPLEYAPRFEGSNEPNEVRVDITFGIIGYVYPRYAGDATVSPKTISRSDSELTFKNYGKASRLDNSFDSMPMSDMKWGDIVLNMGRDDTMGSSALFGDNLKEGRKDV